MGAWSHTLGHAWLLFMPSRQRSCCVSPLGIESAEMAALARSVLVTGSSQGIGLELVRQLAASPRPPSTSLPLAETLRVQEGRSVQAQGMGMVWSQVGEGNLWSQHLCWLSATSGSGWVLQWGVTTLWPYSDTSA